MSLSDYVKLLRAQRGGVTPDEVAAATGVPSGAISWIELKYRRVGEDDEMLARLADYFGVPAEELLSRRERFRKRLTAFLAASARSGQMVRLQLRGGGEVVGRIEWFDRGAVALRQADGGEIVAYRHSVEDWSQADEPPTGA